MSAMRKVKDGKGAIGTLLEGRSARLQREKGKAPASQAEEPVREKTPASSLSAPQIEKDPKIKDDLGLFYRMEDLTFGEGFTARMSKEPINYYAFLLKDGKVRVEYATCGGKPSGMNKMIFLIKKFEAEFTPKDGKMAKRAMEGLTIEETGETEEAGDESAKASKGLIDAPVGLCYKDMDLKVGTGGTSNRTHTEIHFHYTLTDGGDIQVVEATPQGKPWPGFKPRIVSQEEFEKQYIIT